MYKIVDKAGNEIENRFNSFGDALGHIRQLNRLGMKNVFVVDAKTKVIYKKSSKNRYAPKWVTEVSGPGKESSKTMTDLLKRFSKAAKAVSSNNNAIRQLIYKAYNNHLSDINTDDLPEEIQPIYDAFTDRLSSTEPPGDIGNDEANHLANDLLYMTDVLRHQR